MRLSYPDGSCHGAVEVRPEAAEDLLYRRSGAGKPSCITSSVMILQLGLHVLTIAACCYSLCRLGSIVQYKKLRMAMLVILHRQIILSDLLKFESMPPHET
jgi:hypothetical protein